MVALCAFRNDQRLPVVSVEEVERRCAKNGRVLGLRTPPVRKYPLQQPLLPQISTHGEGLVAPLYSLAQTAENSDLGFLMLCTKQESCAGSSP